MKNIKSLPKDKAFFNVYAPFVAAILKAGIFSQIISGLTEMGIIFTGAKKAFEPFGLGWIGLAIAGLVAAVAAATIEVGLKKATPVAVDSILYKRFSGLHTPITILVWLLVIVLAATSGVLSFKNSSVIVDNFTPQAQEQTTAAADSIKASDLSAFKATFKADSTSIAESAKSSLEAAKVATAAKIVAINEQIRAYESKEGRTGQSFISAKDRLRQERANVEAKAAQQLADITNQKASQLSAARESYKSSLQAITASHSATVADIQATNQMEATERQTTVQSHGLGLGWFTLVCLFVFFVSIVVDRLYHKGAGIDQTVQIDAYDFRPSAIVEAVAAVRERLNFALHSRIAKFADRTPAAPLPAKPASLYDMQKVLEGITLKLELQDNAKGKVLYIDAKQPDGQPAQPRQIGFKNHSGDISNATTQGDALRNALGKGNHKPPQTQIRLLGTQRITQPTQPKKWVLACIVVAAMNVKRRGKNSAPNDAD